MRKQETLERLRQHADAIRAFGARSLYLFGSTVRDEALPESDIDLFVDYDDTFSAIELVRLRNYVREILGAEADVTTRDGLHPLIRDEVIASAEKVF
jgi:uncharacterized protein